MDMKKWIFSRDIADWISHNVMLSVPEQIECISMAPHRTMREKLTELKDMRINHPNTCEPLLNDRIASMERILHTANADADGQKTFYRVDIYYMGYKQCFLPDMFFHTKEEAVAAFLAYIEENVEQEGDRGSLCYAVISVLALNMVVSPRYQCIDQIVVRSDGEMICSKETMGEEFHHLKLPYRSGTIIADTESPFLPPVKGILFNHAEPEESGFAENEYNQWLICPQIRALEVTSGIGIINLTDYYNPFSDECGCNLPYKQLLTSYQGDLDEQEEWLAELSEMVREDKSVMAKMLTDRQPKAADNLSKRRLAYVRSLKRTRGSGRG